MIELLTYDVILFLGSIGLLYVSQRIQSENGFAYAFTRREHLFTGGISVLFGTLLFQHREALGGMDALPYLAPLVCLFAVQFMIDINYQELADEWNILIGVASLFYVLYFPDGLFGFRIWSVALLTLFFFMVWFLIGGLGLGDVKFLFAAGILLSVWEAPQYIFISFGMGFIYGMWQLIASGMLFKREGWKREFAFGPFLIIGMVLMLIM